MYFISVLILNALCAKNEVYIQNNHIGIMVEDVVVIYIGSDANYYCDTCGHKSISPVMEWGYRCPDHNDNVNDGQYVGIGDITVLAQVIGTCMSLVTMTGNLWLAELLVNLESQKGVTYTGGR